jgi:CRISPR/Cas system-associated endonuclease Cas3-HD
MIRKLLTIIRNSVFLKRGGKESSTRISAYLVLSIIYLFSIIFLSIEITSAIIALCSIGKYVISNEIIIIFSALLSHHLILLGINKNYENKFLTKERELELLNSNNTKNGSNINKEEENLNSSNQKIINNELG